MLGVTSAFGYTLCKAWTGDDFREVYAVLDGEENVLHVASTSFEAKKWMKDNATSKHWKYDGTWDWSYERMEVR